MCIIIYRPSGAKGLVSKESLITSARNNKDGFGLMWHNKGKLNIWRGGPGWDNAREWISRFLALQKYDIPVAGHARWATHGRVDKSMAHPYWMERGESALMHNGILSTPAGGKAGWSDTKAFIELVLRKLPEDWHAQPHLRYLVEEACTGSKLLIFRKGNLPILVNGSAGMWENGIWYSNAGFRSSPSVSSPFSTNVTSNVSVYDKRGGFVDLDDEGEPSMTKRETKLLFVKALVNSLKDSEDERTWEEYLKERDRQERFAQTVRGTGEAERPRKKIYLYEDIHICDECAALELGPTSSSLREVTDPDAECLLCYGSTGEVESVESVSERDYLDTAGGRHAL